MQAYRTKEIKGYHDDPSYHGVITGVEAEKRLKKNGGNVHLIRYSKTRLVYVLSVYRGKEDPPIVMHYDMKWHRDQKYEIMGAGYRFKTVRDVLNYYRKNPVDHQVNGIGKFLPSKIDDSDSDMESDMEDVSWITTNYTCASK